MICPTPLALLATFSLEQPPSLFGLNDSIINQCGLNMVWWWTAGGGGGLTGGLTGGLQLVDTLVIGCWWPVQGQVDGLTGGGWCSIHWWRLGAHLSLASHTSPLVEIERADKKPPSSRVESSDSVLMRRLVVLIVHIINFNEYATYRLHSHFEASRQLIYLHTKIFCSCYKM